MKDCSTCQTIEFFGKTRSIAECFFPANERPHSLYWLTLFNSFFDTWTIHLRVYSFGYYVKASRDKSVNCFIVCFFYTVWQNVFEKKLSLKSETEYPIFCLFLVGKLWFWVSYKKLWPVGCQLLHKISLCYFFFKQVQVTALPSDNWWTNFDLKKYRRCQKKKTSKDDALSLRNLRVWKALFWIENLLKI